MEKLLSDALTVVLRRQIRLRIVEHKLVLPLPLTEVPCNAVALSIIEREAERAAEAAALPRTVFLPLIVAVLRLPLTGQSVEHDPDKGRQRRLPEAVLPEEDIEPVLEIQRQLVQLSEIFDLTVQ